MAEKTERRGLTRLLRHSADHGTQFAIKSQPDKQQDFLVTLKSPDDPQSQHVVVDPNEIDKTGSTAIQFYAPSLNGKLVAVCLVVGGSENGTLHVYDVATGKALSNVVPRVNFPTGGGSVAWNADASGFYYTRYPHEGERPRRTLTSIRKSTSTSSAPRPIRTPTRWARLSRVSPRSDCSPPLTANTFWRRSPTETVASTNISFLPMASGPELTKFSDDMSAIAFGPGDSLYLVSHHGAPRGQMLRMTASSDLQHAKLIIPQGDWAMEGFGFSLSGFNPAFTAAKDRPVCQLCEWRPGRDSRLHSRRKAKGHGSLRAGLLGFATGQPADGSLLFRNENYVKPGAWFTYSPQSGKTTETALRTNSPVSFDNVEVVRETATSRDGTKVPLTILRERGAKLDGTHPAVLTGYGGFGLSTTPQFDPELKMWLDSGGVYAIANMRGGGEFGESWHKAGMLTEKQHVFDDFIACAEYLVREKYTTRKSWASRVAATAACSWAPFSPSVRSCFVRSSRSLDSMTCFASRRPRTANST